MDIERDVMRLSSDRKYLLIQCFSTQISIIDLETNRQKQVNFRDGVISTFDMFEDKLLIASMDGRIYLQEEHTYTAYKIHSNRIVDIIVNDGMLLSLGEDANLKQTNLHSLQTIYERQLAQSLENGRIFLMGHHVLVQYDLKVILINLENDVIDIKYKFDAQGPLIVQQNNLAKDYFTVLGQEQMLLLFNCHQPNPLKSIQLDQYGNYQLYHLPKSNKTTILLQHHDLIICYLHTDNILTKQYEVNVDKLQSIQQSDNNLIVIWDNISNPKIRYIKNIEHQQFKQLYQQEQLLKYNEKQDKSEQILTNKQQQHPVVALAQTQFEYTNLGQSIVNHKVDNKQVEIEENEMMMTNVLKQALTSRDHSLIEYALDKTQSQWIDQSIQSLSLEMVDALQQILIDKIISYPYLTKKFLPWIKSMVRRGAGDFHRLFYMLEERTTTLKSIQSLHNKLQYLQLKPTINKVNTDYRQQRHTTYTELAEQVKIIQDQQQDNEIDQPIDLDIATDNIEEEFNQTYQRHKKDLRSDALNGVDINQDISADLKF